LAAGAASGLAAERGAPLEARLPGLGPKAFRRPLGGAGGSALEALAAGLGLPGVLGPKGFAGPGGSGPGLPGVSRGFAPGRAGKGVGTVANRFQIVEHFLEMKQNFLQNDPGAIELHLQGMPIRNAVGSLCAEAPLALRLRLQKCLP